LLHDNAPPYKAASDYEFWPPKYYNPLFPLYSPDLSPLDYFLFNKLKMKSADVVETQEAVTDKLKNVQKQEF
jgi:hypothetical protein